MTEQLNFMGGPIESEDSFSLAVIQTRRRILLGRKSRGFAEGRLVLPGGKDHFYLSADGVSLTPGVFGASREVFEEAGLDIPPSAFRQVGMLHVATEEDNKDISIYTTTSSEAELKDSEELRDLSWIDIDELPYDEMPSDYKLWLPHILDGYAVNAYLETDQDRIMGGDVFRQKIDPLGRSEHFSVLHEG